MTNEDRRISASKQLRQASRKAERQMTKLISQSDTTPRKTASPTTLRTPYGMRTVRPLFFDETLNYREAERP